MDKRIYDLLEFTKIINKLCEYAASDVGKECILALIPKTDSESVRTLLKQTAEAESLLIRGGQHPIESFEDVRPNLTRLHAALSLSMRELLLVSRCMKVSRLARERLTQDEAMGLIKHLAGQLCACRSVEEEINRCILSEEEMADGASAELARIRRQIRTLNERAREKLNGMIKSAAYQKYLQEPIITIRNGRFVIPVKQEYRQQVQGLVHDQSGSGATLFVEPVAVVEIGNELKRLASLEQEEIERILIGLTSEIEPHAQDIYNSIGILGELDKIFAKAAFGREIRAVCPEITEHSPIKILGGRHPLLAQEAVVPVDVWLGDAFHTLIITGPNTGGKTVTLKTIGLFTLMAQAGLFIPANEGSRLRCVNAVYADIGDEQSIEQSLSTFSSHMSNIVYILKNADRNSLVLLDELGAGTDPVEGAALAMSILQTLHGRGTLVAATTHYSEIKAFALMNPGMENASMEFDVDKLCPTYRLFIGIPGKSNAFEIAMRLGLDKEVIEDARSLLKKEDVQFEDILQHAQTQRQRAEEERIEAQQHRYELEKLRNKTEEEKRRLENERAALRQKAREEARAIVRESREEMEGVIQELRKLKNVDNKQIERAIQTARDAARKREVSLIDPIYETAEEGEAPKNLRQGDMVKVLSLGQNATILKLMQDKGEAQVQAGIIKLMVKLSDIRKIQEEKKKESVSARFVAESNKLPALCLDVRGKLVDEAIDEVDRYIDDAIIHGREEVQVIHGKGTGALRSGIQAYLKRHPKIQSFRLGNYGEGDAGVTIATLKNT